MDLADFASRIEIHLLDAWRLLHYDIITNNPMYASFVVVLVFLCLFAIHVMLFTYDVCHGLV